jgi:hypothetical protein
LEGGKTPRGVYLSLQEEQQYAIRIRYKGTRVHQATPPLRGCKKDRLTGAYSRF